MSDKSFVDTNIWFYAFVRGDDPARGVKTDAAAACIRGVGHGVLSTQVVSELCVNLIRKADFDENAIRELIDSLFQRYQVAPVS